MSLDPVAALAEGRRLLAGGASGLPALRVAVTGTFSLDYMPPLLASALRPHGAAVAPHLGGFGAWAQELLDEKSALYAFEPDAVLLVTDLEDLFAGWFRSPDLPDAEQKRLVEEMLARFEAALETAARRLPKAVVYVVVPVLDRVPGEQVEGPAEAFRGQRRLGEFLDGLRALRRAWLVDLDFLARRQGADKWRDPRLWYMARMRLSLAGCQALAEAFARRWAASRSPRAKVAVVDLDDTLWGGLAGEQGWKELELGHEGLGLAYRELQEELLRLRASGVLLAVCSKNDEATAVEVFRDHPGMALKREHLACWRVNWNDKAENLADIARELNVGLESLVFLDDDKFQREAVKARLPVQVPDLPADPAARPRFVRELAAFRLESLTAEDARRSEMYSARAEAAKRGAAAASLEDFLRSLGQKAVLSPVGPATIARAEQLCQKTNQFNLTTRRHTRADLEAMLADGRHEAWTLSLSDDLGDHGLVALGILTLSGAEAEIDTLLMSCRVIGREAERALLHLLAVRARERGARALVGRYLPSPKNSQTKDLYPSLGFAPTGDGQTFRLELSQDVLPAPSHIALTVQNAHETKA